MEVQCRIWSCRPFVAAANCFVAIVCAIPAIVVAERYLKRVCNARVWPWGQVFHDIRARTGIDLSPATQLG